MPSIDPIDRSEAQQVATQTLEADTAGRDPLATPEALASSIRRAASFLCPCPPRTVREEVEGTLRGITDVEAGETVEDMIQQLLLIGDLLDLPVEENGRSHRMLHATPPSFVIRDGEQHVLLGIPSDGQGILSESYRGRVEMRGAVRLYHGDPEDARRILTSQGLSEVTSEEWLCLPNKLSPSDYIAGFDKELDQAGSIDAKVDGVEVLDPSTSPRFYKGRWRNPKKGDDGRFVARRTRRFGADFWCYVEVQEGRVHRLIDLPLLPHSETPHDEAWRLQAAIDATRDTPQTYRMRSDEGSPILDVFSPLPSWAERRLRVVSMPSPGERGALRSYRFEDEAASEKELLSQYLWMEEQPSTS